MPPLPNINQMTLTEIMQSHIRLETPKLNKHQTAKHSQQTQGTFLFRFSIPCDCLHKGLASSHSGHFFAQIASVSVSIKAGRHSLLPCQCHMSLDAAAFWQQQSTRLTFSLEARVRLGRNTMVPPRGASRTQGCKSVQWGKILFSSFACKASGMQGTNIYRWVSQPKVTLEPRRREHRLTSHQCQIF